MTDTGPEPTSDLVDIDALRHHLRAEGRSDTIEVLGELSGGTQNIMLRLRWEDQDVVLRRPPLHPRSSSNDALRREMRVLGALADTPVPAPRLLLACPDEEPLGHVFYLTDFLPGVNPTSELPPSVDRDRLAAASGREALTALDLLEAVDHEAVGLADLGRIDGFLERQVPRWLGELGSFDALSGYARSPEINRAEWLGSWLDEHRPPLGTVGLSHGDYHLGNVLLDQDGVTGVVDWEMATIAPSALDAARFIAGWPSQRTRMQTRAGVWDSPALTPIADLCEQYLTSRPGLGEDELAWYVALACFKLGIILEGTYARSCAGRASRDLGGLMHAAALDLLERGVLTAWHGLRDL